LRSALKSIPNPYARVYRMTARTTSGCWRR